LGLREVRAKVTWPDAKRLESEVRAVFGGEAAGLFAALGEPAAPLGALPAGVRGAVRLSVRPALVFHVASKLFKYHNPVRHALVDTQLHAAESQVGLHIDTDVLGEASRPWTFLEVDTAGGRALVAELELADVVGLRRLAQGLVESLGQLGGAEGTGRSPSLSTQQSRYAGVDLLTLGGDAHLTLAFGPHAVTLAADAATVRAHLDRRALPTSGEPVAVASAVSDDRASASALAARWAPGDAAFRKALEGALGQSTVTLVRDGRDWVMGVRTRLGARR
jgi:hypothetical protein